LEGKLLCFAIRVRDSTFCVIIMELICEKYKERVSEAAADCLHPTDYCQFRSSCMIRFLARDRKGLDTSEQQNKKEDSGQRALISELGMDNLRFDKGNGLLPAIVQDWQTNQILMMAYINEEAWRKTLETGKAHYWSRSRNQLWLKGESSGHFQLVKEVLVDCDADTVIYRVEQQGAAACHQGYRSCFFRRVAGGSFVVKEERVFDPQEVYRK
jgi:phosphoribosyl-AMP cyclohydrolase